jgi:predicted ABC-type ATPase
MNEEKPQVVIIAGPKWGWQVNTCSFSPARYTRSQRESGGHDVPEAVVIGRYARGLKNFQAIYQPLADVWSVYDNSGASQPISIASGGRDRPLEVLQRDAWTTFSEINP